jgi:hypothetical protein
MFKGPMSQKPSDLLIHSNGSPQLKQRGVRGVSSSSGPNNPIPGVDQTTFSLGCKCPLRDRFDIVLVSIKGQTTASVTAESIRKLSSTQVEQREGKQGQRRWEEPLLYNR